MYPDEVRPVLLMDSLGGSRPGRDLKVCHGQVDVVSFWAKIGEADARKARATSRRRIATRW